MTKRLTIALIALLAFAMIAILPAAAAINDVAAGDTVYRGEEGLNLVPTGLVAGDTIGYWADGSDITATSPKSTVAITAANVGNFYVTPTTDVGTWYLVNPVTGFAGALAFRVADPSLDIKILDEAGNIINDKTVTKNEVLRFRIDSNLDSFQNRVAVVGAPVGVKITDPNGNVYTQVYDDVGILQNLAVNVNANPFIIPLAFGAVGTWDTGNAEYSRGTYTVKVDCNANSMNDNYDVVGKTVSKSYSITISDDDLIITSNMDTVVRNNDFAVTIEGRPSTDYVLWVKGTSNLAANEVPTIKDGQQGVSKDDGVGVTDANWRGYVAGEYTFSAGNDVAGDTPTVNQYAMVNTNSAGKRTVGFSTTPTTKDQSFTIRVDRYAAIIPANPGAPRVLWPAVVAGPSGDNDEVKVRVEKGDVTITASGDRSYYIGEEVILSGTNTDSANVWLFITGPNLEANGADIDDPSRAAQTVFGVWQSQIRTVKGDNTWEYKWDTSGLALDAGTYTIYAVGAQRDKSQLGNAPVPKYATVSVVIRKGFVSATASQSAVAKGDNLFIRGNAEGNPAPGVAIWVLGRNFYVRDTQTVEDDASYEFELTRATTQNMASGQYFVVIQHPMGNNQFDVVDNRVPGGAVVPFVRYVETRDGMVPGVAPLVGSDAFIVEGAGRLQGSDAAEALIQMINMPNIDDTYTKLTFLVEEPWIRIDTVGDKTVGSTFMITGTTNLGVDNDLLVEVTSSAFQPTEKTQATEFSGASGTVKVVKGDAGYNIWSFEVNAAAFKADEYIVKVESIEADASTTATFNVLESVPVTQPPATQPPATQPPATTPPTEVPATPPSPGFGALVAIAGLGAVAFLVLRRD